MLLIFVFLPSLLLKCKITQLTGNANIQITFSEHIYGKLIILLDSGCLVTKFFSFILNEFMT